MKKFIKTQDGLRVRIKYEKIDNLYSLRLQKKYFIFWVNTSYLVDMSENTTTDKFNVQNPIVNLYLNGGVRERYKKGTMNLKGRAIKLIEEYLKDQEQHKLRIEYLNSL